MAWQCILPEVTVKGFKKHCISNAMDGTDDMLWNGNEEAGNIRSVREKALPVKMETVILTGRGR